MTLPTTGHLLASDTQRAPSDKELRGKTFLPVPDDLQRITAARPQPIVSVWRRGKWVLQGSHEDTGYRVFTHGSHAGVSTVHMAARWVQVVETGEIFCAMRFWYPEEGMPGDQWLAALGKAGDRWPVVLEDIEMPKGFEMIDGTAMKVVRDADGNMLARFTMDHVILDAHVVPPPPRTRQ